MPARQSALITNGIASAGAIADIWVCKTITSGNCISQNFHTSPAPNRRAAHPTSLPINRGASTLICCSWISPKGDRAASSKRSVRESVYVHLARRIHVGELLPIQHRRTNRASTTGNWLVTKTVPQAKQNIFNFVACGSPSLLLIFFSAPLT